MEQDTVMPALINWHIISLLATWGFSIEKENGIQYDKQTIGGYCESWQVEN